VRPFFHFVSGSSKSQIHASAGLALGLCALVVSACNGPTSSLSPTTAALQRSQITKPLVSSSPTPTPIPFVFQTVDDPNSSHNQVNGINQLQTIVGTYGAGQGSNLDRSYNAKSPYTKFLHLNYSGAQGTFASGLSSNFMRVGYVINPGSQSGIWGFVKIRGLWTLFADPNEGTGSYAVTELWGINDSSYAVGFYINSSGTDVPIEVNVPTESYTELQPPGAIGAQATGINGKGDISGWETTSNGTQGFFLKTGSYYTFSVPGAKATYALSVNWQDQVAGYYVDASDKTHGFVLTGPTRGGAQQNWQTVDEPKAAAGSTWVTGINNHKYICGYYVDSSGQQHGFVAAP
jgi:hypothetical protein